MIANGTLRVEGDSDMERRNTLRLILNSKIHLQFTSDSLLFYEAE